jgi:APA family basic amino acid/polyamine antiporter
MIDRVTAEHGSRDVSRLARRLGFFDAVVIGLGAMIGAGVFAAFGPAARAAGSGLIVGLLVACFVAYCNATSSADLAALYPESGGAYIYGRRRLGAFWGFLAGWSFVVGKVASCAAMAMTFASYAAPGIERPLAISAVIILTAINYRGIEITAALTRGIVGFVLFTLAFIVIAMFMGGTVDPSRLSLPPNLTVYGVLQSAGFLFFAFAGYARLATLGEEVIDPARTIPRAIPVALGITMIAYVLVAIGALLAVGASALSSSSAPLMTAVEAGRFASFASVVRLGAAVASLGVLLSLIAGVSRTVFAMAANGDLPGFFSAVHPQYRVPYRAEMAVGFIVAAVCAIADVRAAIGFSSFGVLFYYAIANASALTLKPAERRWPRWLAFSGAAGCILIVFSLPLSAVIAGAIVQLVGCALLLARQGRMK